MDQTPIQEPNDNLPIILRDTREKAEHGYRFNITDRCGGTEECKLDYGDYQLKGFPDLIVIERKASVVELCGNLGAHRERFEAELQRMIDAGVKYKYVVIEDYWSSVLRKNFSGMHPNAVFESIIALQLKYDIGFMFCGTKDMAHRVTRSLLLRAHKYRKDGKI